MLSPSRNHGMWDTMWPFKRQPLLDPDTARWHVDNACWFLRRLAQVSDVQKRQLILPGPGFYKLGKATGQALADRIIDQTRYMAGLTDWTLDVIVYDDNAMLFELREEEDVDSDEPEETPDLKDGGETQNQTWPPELDTTPIHYPESAANDPFRFIIFIARVLAWRVAVSCAEEPPCDNSEHAGLMDLAACLMGFGVFLSDAAIGSVSRSGYRYGYVEYFQSSDLSETELLFDLALFLVAHDLPAGNTQEYLKVALVEPFLHALEDAQAYRQELRLARDAY